jgi:PAS domain S-box-containing protein
MLETISSLFDPADLSPHGLCLVWRPELIGLHVISDAVTGLAYYSIPLALVAFVRWRRDLVFGWMFGLFAVFILACGTTHFFSIWTLWHPDYGTQGVVKAATAMVSILTAIMLWPLLPKAVALPSPTQLAILNVTLQREIAERCEAEKRLRASEARYAGFFNNLAEGLFISAVDADGHLILEAINRNLATAAGLDPARSIGHPVDEVLPQAVAAKIGQCYRSDLGIGGPLEFEDTVELATGVHTWHTVLVPLRDEDGRVVQLLGSIRDITERQRLQIELVQASKLATLGTLTAGMAHELSQPLNIIRLWIDEAAARLREAPLESGHAAPIEQTFALIVEQTVRMRSIIDHMRVFTRREGDAAQDFDIVGSIRMAVEMTRRQYVKEDIAVEFNGAPGEAWAHGQPVHLEQVVLNLLANAHDAIVARRSDRPDWPGHIQITVSQITVSQITVSTSARQEVAVVVTDTGGGIPPAALPHLFDPFFTTKAPGQGCGLGLWISHGLIAAMGGHLHADNVTQGGLSGARFTMKLPTVPARKQRGAHDGETDSSRTGC